MSVWHSLWGTLVCPYRCELQDETFPKLASVKEPLARMGDTLSQLRGQWPTGLWPAGCLLSCCAARRSSGGCTAMAFPSLSLFHLSCSSHDNACCHPRELRVGRNQTACQQWTKHSLRSISGHSQGELICFAKMVLSWASCRSWQYTLKSCIPAHHPRPGHTEKEFI